MGPSFFAPAVRRYRCAGTWFGVLWAGAAVVLRPGPSRRAGLPDSEFGRSRIPERRCGMLRLAVIFFIIAIVAAIFGFGGIAGDAAWIAKILLVVFVILFLISLILGRRRP